MLRDALHAYEQRLRQQAIDSHRHETLVWAIQTQWSKDAGKPPAMPPILAEQ
jgi:hypothetical protein